MTKIKIGIIGYGSWVKEAYLPALQHDGRAEIIALSAKSEETINLINRDFGNSVDVYHGFEDLLSSPGVQAVMIAVPDSIHAKAISSALDSGKDVFYEPPVAHTRALIPEVLRKLLDSSQITHADLELALVPAVIRTAELIKHQMIGQVQTVSIRLLSNWGPDPNQDTNNINRLSVWYIHVLNVLLNSSPKRVLLMDGYGTSGNRQSQCAGYYDYNGIWGELKVNIDSIVDLSINIEIVGSYGEILVNVLTGEIKIRTKNKTVWKIEKLPAIKPYADWPGMHESITCFLNAVISRNPSFANAETVAKLHLIGLASEESGKTGNWAEVKHLNEL